MRKKIIRKTPLVFFIQNVGGLMDVTCLNLSNLSQKSSILCKGFFLSSKVLLIDLSILVSNYLVLLCNLESGLFLKKNTHTELLPNYALIKRGLIRGLRPKIRGVSQRRKKHFFDVAPIREQKKNDREAFYFFPPTPPYSWKVRLIHEKSYTLAKFAHHQTSSTHKKNKTLRVFFIFNRNK